MSANTARLIATRPCLVYGQPVPRGFKVELPLLEALDAAETGRLAFVDPTDRERCMQARRDQIARELRQVAAPDPGSPWRPRH